VIVNRVLKRILGPKRDEETGELRTLHDLRSSPNIIQVMKSRSIRRARLVAH
jgi:hypothetical protein